MLKHMGAYTVARLTILRLFKKVEVTHPIDNYAAAIVEVHYPYWPVFHEKHEDAEFALGLATDVLLCNRTHCSSVQWLLGTL